VKYDTKDLDDFMNSRSNAGTPDCMRAAREHINRLETLRSKMCALMVAVLTIPFGAPEYMKALSEIRELLIQSGYRDTSGVIIIPSNDEEFRTYLHDVFGPLFDAHNVKSKP
jgi:hypothetical protein